MSRPNYVEIQIACHFMFNILPSIYRQYYALYANCRFECE